MVNEYEYLMSIVLCGDDFEASIGRYLVGQYRQEIEAAIDELKRPKTELDRWFRDRWYENMRVSRRQGKRDGRNSL
jgi:hypothetical protein